jgi:Zn-dependent peptidase ImmA (M78 family)/transcriptional regulator with XRE-family HTH domain
MPGAAFRPDRLRYARLLRGLRQNQLAEQIEVSSSAVSQFEAGTSAPDPTTTERIALVLGCTPDFFTRPLQGQADEPFFRSRRAASKLERESARAYALAISEIAALLDESVEMPSLAVRRPTETLAPDTPQSVIEGRAADLRRSWGLPPGPVPNVVRLIESRGVVVVAMGAFEHVDAFSLRAVPRPVIVLCSDHGNAARRRFDAAHELAHLVLHNHPAEANRAQETQAHGFAASFLMPAEEVDPWLPRSSGQLDLLEDGSTIWGVSMQALLFRARTLGTLSEDAYRRTMRRMSAAGWRTKEPVEIGPPEIPSLLRLAVTALPEAGTSVKVIAERFGVPLERLKRMLRLPEETGELGELAYFSQAARG